MQQISLSPLEVVFNLRSSCLKDATDFTLTLKVVYNLRSSSSRVVYILKEPEL